MLDIAEMHHQSLWKRSEVISNTKITTFSPFNLSTFVILCTYCFKCVDGEESIFGLFDYSGYDCSNLCMNKGISAAPGLLCTALIKLSMTCSLVCWLHLFISLLIFVLFFRLCQFCNNAYWTGQDYPVRFTVRCLVISSSKDEGVEDVKMSKLILVLGHYSALFNKWMDGMKH